MAISEKSAVQFAHRVLIIQQSLPVPLDRQSWQQALELTRLGYIISVICPKAGGYSASHEVVEGVHIFRHPPLAEAKNAAGYLFEYGGTLLWEFMLAGRVFFTTGFDAIHACNPPDTAFFVGGFFKLFFAKKFILDFRTPGPELYEARFKARGSSYKVAQWLERAICRLANLCIVSNDSGRGIVTGRGKVPSDRVFLVRPGPDLTRIRTVTPAPSLKKKRAYMVAFAGFIGRLSGIAHLIEAVRILVHDMHRSDIQFVIAGDGPALGDARKLSSMLDVADFITFTGQEEALQVVSTADLCVAPDDANPASDKTTSTKVMDYMALGKPVIQFDTIEGRFTSAEASLYARPNDPQDLAEKIAALLDDPVKRSEMGALGRTRVESELAWSHHAPQLSAAYDTLFGSEND